MQLLDEVRAGCRAIAESARFVSIDLDAWRDPPAASLADAGPGDADHVLQLDAINFGSGWFPTLRKRPGLSGYRTSRPRSASTGRGATRSCARSTHRRWPPCSDRSPGTR